MSHELKAITGLFVPSGSLIQGTLASGTVTSGSIGSAAVLSGNIASGQVGTFHIASGAITGDLIASGAVSSVDLADNSVVSGKIASGSVSWFALGSGVVNSGNLGVNSVVSGNIASGAVGLFGLASGVVVSGIIGNNAVNSGNISSGAVGLYQLGVASGTVEGTQLTLDPDTGMMVWSNPSAISTRVKNGTGAIISGLAVVYISGGGGANPFVAPALANADATSLATFGVATSNIGANAEGTVVTQGILTGVNTSAFNDGDVLWLSPTVAGGVTTTKPQAPNHLVLVGYVTNAANNGAIEVAIQNGYEIEELHDVKILSGSLQSGQILQYSSGVWWNQTFVAGATNLGSGSVTANAIASGQVGPNALASGAIAGLIASGAIGSGDLGIGAVNNENISSGTVANDKLANSTVTIAGSSTALGGSWAALALTTSSGLLAGTYYPSGALTIGVASGGITSELLADNAVASGDVAIGAINNQNIASGSVANDKLTNSTVTIAGSSTSLGGSWAAQSLTAASGLSSVTYYPSGAAVFGIASGGIVAQMMGSGSVTTNAIASGSITANLLASGAVSDIVGSGSITSGDVGIGAINNLNVASGTLSNDKLANSTVTIAGSSTALGGSWAALALTTSSGLLAGTYYPSGALTIGIASGGITSQMLADAAVNTNDIASGAVGTNEIASGAVTGINIAATTVANVNLVNSAVTIAGSSTALGASWAAAALTTSSGLLAGTYYPSGALTIGIASGGIVAQMLGSGSVTTNAIASGSVTANALASGAVADIVGSGSVTSGDLGIGAVNDLNVASGTLSNDKLVNSAITIAGSSTALGGSWAAQSLTAASGLSAVTYYPSGSAVFGIASGGIVAQMLGNGSVTSGAIGSGQIGQFHLASGAANLLLTSGIVVSGMIGNNAITSGNISSGSIGQMHLNQLLIPKMQAPGRLSLYSGEPVVASGLMSGKNKIYYNPYNGSTIALYDGISWLEYEINLPIEYTLPGLQSGQLYDIFMYGTGGASGTPYLQTGPAWTSGGNRQPIIYRNGIPIENFSNGRYLGTFMTTTSTTTEDSKFRRFLWNYDNRVTKTLYYTDSTQHTYNSQTPRVWNLNSGARLEFVQGMAGIGASTSCFVASYVTPGATSVSSFESDGVFSGTNYNVYNTFTGLFWEQSPMMVGECNVGYNFLQLMESCQSGTVTNVSMTLTGTIEG